MSEVSKKTRLETAKGYLSGGSWQMALAHSAVVIAEGVLELVDIARQIRDRQPEVVSTRVGRIPTRVPTLEEEHRSREGGW